MHAPEIDETQKEADIPVFKNELEFQTAIADIALLNGWLVYYNPDSRRSPSGFPDLVLLRENELIFVEVKMPHKRPTAKQWEWLRRLILKPGVDAYVWHPADFPVIEEVLK